MKKFLLAITSMLFLFAAYCTYSARYFLFFEYYDFSPNIRHRVDLSSPGLIYSGKASHNHPILFRYGFIMEGMDNRTFQLNYYKSQYNLPPIKLKVRIDFFNQLGDIVYTITNPNQYSTTLLDVSDTMSAPAFELGTYSTRSGLPLNEPLICNVTLLEIDDELHKYGPFTFFIKPFYTL